MNTPAPTNRYKNHRFPVEIISHGVWLYYRFCLSYRGVEDLLSSRGVSVTYEPLRQWWRKFGQQYANQPRRRDKHAAKTFFRQLLTGLTYVPRAPVTDKLKSYGAA